MTTTVVHYRHSDPMKFKGYAQYDSFDVYDRYGYACGQLPPNYPVPCTASVAVTSLFHRPEIINWSAHWVSLQLSETIALY